MSNSVLACLGNIFVEPKKALQDIRPHTIWWLYPIIITIIIVIAWNIWYFVSVDIGWLANQMIAAMGDKYSSDQLEKIRQNFSRKYFLIFGIIGGSFGIVIISLLQALYFFMVSKIGGYEEQSYGRWFNFTAWTSFPNVLAYIAMAIGYLFASSQTSFYTADITSLNTLLFHLPMSNHLMGVAASVHLTTFWVLGLMCFGFAQWTKQSLGKSTVIVLAPWVIIYALILIVKLV
ncbi:MAG TPA: YIP1 family protein [Gammaproteobacteria bacterium]|nr:YIP1 family protein [Gammaproteobacteria bacterium]